MSTAIPNTLIRIVYVLGVAGSNEKTKWRVLLALAVLRIAQFFHPKSPDHLVRRAYCQAKLGNHEAAITSCKTALNIDPEYDQALLGMASIYFEHGVLDSAVEMYNSYIKRVPNDYDTIFQAAILHNYIKDWEGALRYLEPLCENCPTAHAFQNLGVAYERSGQQLKAACAFRRSYELNNSYVLGAETDVRLLLDLGFKEEAFEKLVLLVQKHPSELHFVGLLAWFHATRGEAELARKLCEELEEVNSESKNVWEMLEDTYKLLHDEAGVKRASEQVQVTEIPKNRPNDLDFVSRHV